MCPALAPRQRGQATTTGAAWGCGGGAAAASPGSGEPQLAQKRPFAGLPVPQRTQRFSTPAPKWSAGAAGRGITSTRGSGRAGCWRCGGGRKRGCHGRRTPRLRGAFRRFPQSWQNLRPSGLSRPQRLQFTTSWPLLPFALIPALRSWDATRPGPLRQQDYRRRGRAVASPAGVTSAKADPALR